MTEKNPKPADKKSPILPDPAMVASLYLDGEDWAFAFEACLAELAAERASQIRRVTAFLERTRGVTHTSESDITMQAIVEYLRTQSEPQSATSIAKHFGHDAAKDAPGLSTMLRKASEEGLLVMQGVKRGVTYKVAV